MLILMDAYNKKNLRFFLFLEIITIIILIWIDHPYDDVFTCGRSIKNINKSVSSLNICFKRYLAEYVGKTEIDKSRLYKNTPYDNSNQRTKIYNDNISSYAYMKNKESKKLKLYKTGYKHRYAKKKGLSKLDCYYENKIFKKIDYLYNLADNWNSDKKSFKKRIMKEYGIRLILFSLLPCLGLILLILFGDKKIGRGIIKICLGTDSNHDDSGATCGGIHKVITQETFNYIENANFVFSLLMIIIVIFVFIYIFLKVIKYERLKEGKNKMRKKEYFNYFKEVFNLK